MFKLFSRFNNLKCFERIGIKKFSSFKDIHKYSQKKNNNISMDNLLSFKKISKNHRTRMLNEDLKYRLASKINEIEKFPGGISMMPSIIKVNKWYIQSFNELLNIDVNKNDEYNDILEGIYNRHSATLITVANGIKEYKDYLYDLHGDKFNLVEYLGYNNRGKIINNYLDYFYTNRISIRLLISHYLELQNDKNNEIYYNGIVSIKEPITNVIQEAIDLSQSICEKVYNEYPDVDIEVIGGKPIFPFIRNNMYYIFLEILKNSMRAIMEKYNNSEDIPKIKVSIYNYDNDISIKISDVGVGINHKNLDTIWSYFYSTAKTKKFDSNIELSDFDNNSPLAGYGYGLPITNLMVKYFNDKININSIKNVGTDVILHFSKISI